MTINEFIDNITFCLRNQSGEFSDAELLSYLNRAYSCLYTVLIKQKNELVRTGSDAFTTIIGTQYYDVSSMNILIIDKIWVNEYEPMKDCFEEDLFSSINEEEKGNTGHRCRPEEYCLIGDIIWFRQSPSAVYTINVKYFPTFTTLTNYEADMPLKGMFNQSLIQAVEMYARFRNEMNPSINIQLMTLFQVEANFLLGKRSKKNVRFSFDKRLRR